MPVSGIRTLLLAVLLGAAALLSGQMTATADGEITVRVDDHVNDDGFPTITVVVTADEAGRPLGSLLPSEIQIAEGPTGGATAARVTDVTPATGTIPMALVITIDVSGSMAGPAIDQARAFAASLVNSLAPDDMAALVTFSDSVQVVQPFTSDKNVLLGAIGTIVARGNTALYEAVARSAELSTQEVPRRAVVIISDGENFGVPPTATRDGSLEAAANASTFYVVGVGNLVDRPYLQSLADLTGGRYFEAPAPTELPGIYASIEELLRAQYAVTFESAATPLGRDREVLVRIERGGASGEATHSYQSDRPGAVATPTPTSTPTPAATATPVPSAATDSEEGGFPVALAVVGGVLVLGAIPAAVVLIGRRRRRPSRLPTIVEDNVVDRAPLPPPTLPGALATGEQHGVLVVTGTDFFERVPIGDAPVTVGSGMGDSVRLPESPRVAPQHVRIWLRDGVLMLHHLAPGFETRLGGQAVTWASNPDGLDVEVGPFTIRYENGSTQHD